MSADWIPKGTSPAEYGVEYSKVKNFRMQSFTYEFNERDIILYALGVGAAVQDPTSDESLSLTYENNEHFSPLPSFWVLPPFQAIIDVVRIPGLKFNPMMLLHGETHLILAKPSSQLPASGKVTTHAHISQVSDKKSATSVEITAHTVDENNQLAFTNIMTMFIRGIGGFSSTQQLVDTLPAPTDYQAKYDIKKLAPAPADITPTYTFSDATTPHQAVLYRLSGDRNPLHVDPQLAKIGGFPKPILHGLCTLGFATRAIVSQVCQGNKDGIREIKVRFLKPVMPGQSITTRMWVLPHKTTSYTAPAYYVVFQTICDDNGAPVLIGNCIVTGIDHTPSLATVNAKL